MTPEQKLDALFAADAPPARDYAFEADVAERIARRRAWLTVVALSPWALIAGIVLWALQPVLAGLSIELAVLIQPLALVLGASTVAVGVGLWAVTGLQRRVTVAATPK
ncbi:hypothetical protein GCM10009422_21720 [Brevundimonas kwangchunensis]|uniref:DUF485 domain-containing protein n=1 Tax=Brevundimonas kwangchunensis TaxID=322163 RepID=A0ABN1GZW7_9CAUL